MIIPTDDLVLRTVTDSDMEEIARMWNFFDGGVSPEEARGALAYMTENHARNAGGTFYHLCLAVCPKETPGRILGWCGLDGKAHPERPDIFVLLHEDVRNRGYGTQCAKALIACAFDTLGLKKVHGGCDKQNTASAGMMEKSGMRRYGSEDNGDPLYIISIADYRRQEEKS